MFKIEGFEGEEYEAETAAKAVEAMRASSWGGEQSDGIKGYMKQMAKRVMEWNGEHVRVGKAEEFLVDMHRSKMIRVLKNGKPIDEQPAEQGGSGVPSDWKLPS